VATDAARDSFTSLASWVAEAGCASDEAGLCAVGDLEFEALVALWEREVRGELGGDDHAADAVELDEGSRSS
jgi:hypothetical protein